MEFEWWEAKRLAVLSERGLDFLDARSLFDGRDIYTIPSPRGTFSATLPRKRGRVRVGVSNGTSPG
jgi:uncharacterized DUF497 family protein